MVFRFITSAEIKRRADHFEPFVVGQYEMDVATFCERSVDVMGEESDHIHAQALTDALQVCCYLCYLLSCSVPPSACLTTTSLSHTTSSIICLVGSVC